MASGKGGVKLLDVHDYRVRDGLVIRLNGIND